VAAIPFGLITWVGVSSAQNRQKAWPLVQSVVHRLEDPQQAQRLWERNPSLHVAYPTFQAFQEELALWLPQFGPVPSQEPSESRDRYRLMASPTDLQVALQGQKGAWIRLSIEGPGPFGIGTVAGEGITEVIFADQHAGLRERQQHFQNQRQKALWTKFREVESRLRDEQATRQLWEREPKLHASYKGQEDLVRVTAPWRGKHAPLPEDMDTAHAARIQIRDGGDGLTETAGCPGPDGLMLWVTWRDGTLEDIHPTLEAHAH
jgi:hypothetical protein